MTRQVQSLEVGVGVSSARDGYQAALEAARTAAAGITTHSFSVVLVYASVHYDLVDALCAIKSVVGDIPILGTTTSGEICNGPYHDSIVVTILASPYLAVHTGVGRDVSAGLDRAIDQALQTPALQPFFQLDSKRRQTMTREGASAFGLLFSPGNTKHADSRSYEILEQLKLKSFGLLPIVGGSSADNGKLEKNYVLLNDEIYPDSILLAVFETQLQFGISLSHGFSVTPRQVTITAIEGREVLTLDGKPAADVLTAMMNSSRAELMGKHITFVTGFAIGISDPMGQYNVVISTYLTERGGVRFTQPLPVGAVLTVLEPHFPIMVQAGPDVLRKTILRGAIERPGVSFVNYCAIRPRLMGEEFSKQEIAAMTDMMAGVPLVGFFSYGEQGVADDGISRQNNVAISALTLGLDLSQAAIAIENTRLQAEIRDKAELLAIRNNELQEEIADRRRTEQALQKSQELLRQLVAYQEQVKEDERKRIAREIHDELGQGLMVLRIDASMLQTRTSNSHPRLNEKVRLALDQIDANIKAVRAIINNLRPSVLDLGLHAAIEWQISQFERRHAAIACKLEMDGMDAAFDLDEARATALFRVLQESLSNVARHAQASQVHVKLSRDRDRLHMTIIDNGVGIFPCNRRKSNSFGLLGIEERISALGGEFKIEGNAGEGTVLTFSIPLETDTLAAAE
jgi:signal transduction histidine kinase